MTLILNAVPGKISFRKGNVYLAQRDHGAVVKVKCLQGGKNPILLPEGSSMAFVLGHHHFNWIMPLPKIKSS